MKVLITGSSGFIGSHLSEEFERWGYSVIRCDLKTDKNTVAMDINDPEMILGILRESKPDILVNMAGQANVGLSWAKPQLTFQLNTIGLINILEAVRTTNPSMRVIAVGSSDEYGTLLGRGSNVTEDIPVKPINPYAISKQAQEMFAQLYSRSYGMNICMIRLFNLVGPGQAKGYMVSDFASGIADVEAGKKQFITVGNLESARDFTHIKDAVRAIRLLAEKGHSGEIYNIASGSTYTAHEVLNKLIAMAKTDIKIVQDPAKMRPSDTPVICGNHDKLTEHTAWQPEHSLDEALKEVLEYWRVKN